MLMTAAQWNMRLENEYKAMCAFPVNSLFSWKIADNQTTPRVKAYLVTYRVKTMVKVNGRLKAQNETQVLITLPDSPSGTPTAKIVSGQIPYHPNIYTNGNFCIGNIWSTEPILWKFVINLGKVLAFDPAHTAPGDAANRDAAADWNRKQARPVKPYPCGSINFPHPVGY